MFSRFARHLSNLLGSSYAFGLALFFVITWLLTGPLFNYSETWQLVINTSTTIVTFLMIFLLQNTQNRDTMAIHLKLDEVIRSHHEAHNEMLKIEQLSDDDLKALLTRYETLASQLKEKMKAGTPEV